MDIKITIPDDLADAINAELKSAAYRGMQVETEPGVWVQRHLYPNGLTDYLSVQAAAIIEDFVHRLPVKPKLISDLDAEIEAKQVQRRELMQPVVTATRR